MRCLIRLRRHRARRRAARNAATGPAALAWLADRADAAERDAALRAALVSFLHAAAHAGLSRAAGLALVSWMIGAYMGARR